MMQAWPGQAIEVRPHSQPRLLPRRARFSPALSNRSDIMKRTALFRYAIRLVATLTSLTCVFPIKKPTLCGDRNREKMQG